MNHHCTCVFLRRRIEHNYSDENCLKSCIETRVSHFLVIRMSSFHIHTVTAHCTMYSSTFILLYIYLIVSNRGF